MVFNLNQEQEKAVQRLLENISVDTPDIVLLSTYINKIRSTLGVKQVNYRELECSICGVDVIPENPGSSLINGHWVHNGFCL